MRGACDKYSDFRAMMPVHPPQEGPDFPGSEASLMHQAAVILGLIVINALFASAELALVSARRPRLKALAESGHRGARAALALLDDPTRLLSTVQTGITLVAVFAGLYSGAAYSAQLTAWIARVYPSAAPYAKEIANTTVVIVMTYVT